MNFDNTSVRRQDRLLSQARAEELIDAAEYGILSMVSTDGGGYGLPLSFVREADHLYFHCAPEGEKLRCLARNPRVTFCIVGRTHVLPGRFTTEYESVLLRGEAKVVANDAERMHALELLLGKYCPQDLAVGRKYAEKSFHRTAILRLDVQSVSAKSKAVRG